MKIRVITVDGAVRFLIENHSELYKEHRFEKISDCAESIMKHEVPNTVFRHDDGSWIKDEYCYHFMSLIEKITTRWDKTEDEKRSNT